MPMKVRYTTVNGQVIAENRGGVRKLYTPDPLGSTVVLTDDTQIITDTFSYWPYGEIVSRTGTTATPFQYVGTLGYYTDSGSASYVRSRYLRRDVGQWQSEDPIGRSYTELNLYRYVWNNPLITADPSGKNPPARSGGGNSPACQQAGKTCAGSALGGTICVGGTIQPCVWYNGPSNCVYNCILNHENGHIGDGNYLPCNSPGSTPCCAGITRPPMQNVPQSECKQFAASVECLEKCCSTESPGSPASKSCANSEHNACCGLKAMCFAGPPPPPDVVRRCAAITKKKPCPNL